MQESPAPKADALTSANFVTGTIHAAKVNTGAICPTPALYRTAATSPGSSSSSQTPALVPVDGPAPPPGSPHPADTGVEGEREYHVRVGCETGDMHGW